MMSTHKASLRKEMLKRRKGVLDARKQEDYVVRKLVSMIEQKSLNSVFSYMAFRDELNLNGLHKHCIERGIPLYLPKMSKNGRMDFFETRQLEGLVENKYGILEPVGEGEGELPQADSLVLVPALAMTSTGKRLGYGGGYYDRFLEKISQATIVAVVFREQILEDLPVLAHDITIKNIVYYDLP